VTFWTTTRSPIRSVFSIDCDGMMNICPTNARSNDETITAPMTTSAISRRKDRKPCLRARVGGGVVTVSLAAIGPVLLVVAGSARRTRRREAVRRRASP